jgi:hypothetical protein
MLVIASAWVDLVGGVDEAIVGRDSDMGARIGCVAMGMLAGLVAMTFGGPSALTRESFQNGFPIDVGFFPLGVWLQSPSSAPRYKAMGINTFVGLWKGPTELQLAMLARYSMFAVTDQNDVGLNSPNRYLIKAWLDSRDEPDNAQLMAYGLFRACIPASEVVRRSHEMKGRDPTRPVMVIFGQGIANEFWRGRGLCNGDMNYYNVAIDGADILAFDIYPVGSTSPQVKGKLEYVARGVTNLLERASPGQTVWNAIETTSLDPQFPVTPGQVRSEVWMALVHGSTGIVYFVHEFEPRFREDAIFRYPKTVEEVAKINQLITALSPVLKSPNVLGKLTVSSAVPIAMMVKRYEGALYVFAVAMQNEICQAKFSIGEFADGQADVIDETRGIKIVSGLFEDSFAGYDAHIYKIPIGP